MTGNTMLFVILAVLAALVIAVIAYQVARFMRGTIRLSLPRTAFNPGDKIAGSFDLHAKKAIQGKRLFVRLVGIQLTQTRRDGKTQTRSREIYRDEVLVEEATDYPADYRKVYNFEISAPDMQSPAFLDSAAGQALTAAFRLLSDRSTYLKWKVEARLEARGIGLVAARPVTVNTRHLP